MTLLSPEIVEDRNSRRVLQNQRDVLNPLLGNDNRDPHNTRKAVTQQQLVDLKLANRDGLGGLRSILSESENIEDAFLEWLQNGFLRQNLQNAGFTIGAEAANVINVSIQLQDGLGNALDGIREITMFLSGSADGSDFVATAPSGGVAIGTNGDLLDSTAANKVFHIISNSSAVFDVDITEVGAATFYMVIVTETSGIKVSSAITFV